MLRNPIRKAVQPRSLKVQAGHALASARLSFAHKAPGKSAYLGLRWLEKIGNDADSFGVEPCQRERLAFERIR